MLGKVQKEKKNSFLLVVISPKNPLNLQFKTKTNDTDDAIKFCVIIESKHQYHRLRFICISRLVSKAHFSKAMREMKRGGNVLLRCDFSLKPNKSDLERGVVELLRQEIYHEEVV